MLLWRAVLWVSVCGAAFVHVGSAYQRTMIGGVFRVVKGGFSRVRISHVIPTTPPHAIPALSPSLPHHPDSRLRGNDGRGCGI